MTPRADRMFLCALLLFAMGCQSAHDRRFLACRDRITDGMTKQQVEEIMQGVAVRGSDHEACKRRDSLTQPEHADCWHFEMKHRSVDRRTISSWSFSIWRGGSLGNATSSG